MTNTACVRELAVNTVIEVLEHNKYSHIEIRNVLNKNSSMSKQERSFYTRLAEGTIERAIQLDYIINQFSKISTKKMKPFIRNLLRVSVYQLKYMDSVPDSAVCNEAVKLAQKRGFFNLKGFVNGVLRNVARNIDKLNFPDKDNDLVSYLEIKYSTPRFLVEKYINDFGEDTAEKILNGYFDNEDVTTVRVNTSLASVECVVSQITASGINVTKNPYYENALDISGYDNLNDIETFKKGIIAVQNVSSMIVGAVAAPKDGDLIIDVCAAPGGKSIHVADMMSGTGKVIARDLTEYKVSLINDNIARMGFKNIIAQKHDALVVDDKLKEKADIVIADLPCSGLGVFGNKSDIKYKVNQQQLIELEQLQKNILSAVCNYVKPGGCLIYSTCTINPGENIKNAVWFKENFPFEFENIEKEIPAEFGSDTAKDGYIQILPGIHKADGFFIAKFKRKST